MACLVLSSAPLKDPPGNYTISIYPDESGNVQILKGRNESKDDRKKHADKDIVVAVMRLGLLQQQTTVAEQRHHLSLSEVTQWEVWLDGLDTTGNPTAIFTSAIKG